MNFSLSEEQKMIRQTAREFAINELAPGVVERDEKKIWPKESIQKMGELGFMGMMVSPDWNGGGMDVISYAIAMEEIARIDASASVVMSVNNSLVCFLLEKFGSDFQKEKYLKPLASGEKLGAYSLSEPQSGSDASNMKTIAKKEGDFYIINGTKNWVTNGINSDIVMLFAVTEQGIGHKGISCFIIENCSKYVKIELFCVDNWQFNGGENCYNPYKVEAQCDDEESEDDSDGESEL